MTGNTFVRTLQEDPDHPGDLVLELGDEICNPLGWLPGDTIQWIDNQDGTFTLRKLINKET